MNLNLIIGPADGFRIWNESKWKNFLNKQDLVKITYGEQYSIIELLDTIAVNLEDKIHGSQYPIIQQIVTGDFYGWYEDELKALTNEINSIITKFKELPVTKQIKRDNQNDNNKIIFYQEDELKNSNYSNLYELNKKLLDTLFNYAVEAQSKNKGLILIPEKAEFNEYGKMIRPEINLLKDETKEKIKEEINLDSKFKNGANWFYWIAGLSIINSIIILMNGSWSFIIGLGITQIIDGLIMGIEEIPNFVAIILDLIFAGLFVLFGFLARKKMKPVFIIGIIIYSLDGLLFLIVKDFLSIAFHAFAIYGIINGLRALNKINKSSFEN